MRIWLALAGVVAVLFTINPAWPLAMTPEQWDALAQWAYSQAEARDAGLGLPKHEAMVREANAELGADVVAMLVRELNKVYADGKTPIAAAMDARFECYSRKGEVGVEVKGN